jgi:RNA polymerase sigma factor (sigma-70 family)
MAAGQHISIVRHLHGLLGSVRPTELTDRQLLARFTASGDEDAFGSLVWRHGPLVLGVCRRVLHHEQDAEDAFQATFLVLARKAACVRWHESIGHWLHETAHRLALKLRTANVRRRTQEQQMREVGAPGQTMGAAWKELCAVLDDELRHLPTLYRLPLLLCYLEGQTQDQAARQLGWSQRTLRRRLEGGRERLRARLVRRGVVLSAALLTLSLTQPKASAVPASLVQTVLLATKRDIAGAVISERVWALAQAAMRGEMLARAKITLTLLLFGLCLGTVGAGLFVERTQPEKIPEQVATPPKPDVGDKVHLDWQGDSLPAGAVARLGSARLRQGGAINAVAYSPDGKLLASGGGYHELRIWDARTGKELQRMIGLSSWPFSIAFSPDGKTLASGANDNTARLWDVATGKLLWTTREKGAISSVVFSSDGKTLAAGCWDGRVRLLGAATGQCVRTFERHASRVMTVALSPDDKLLASGSWEDKRICLWDATTGKLLRELGNCAHEACESRFSPDGKTLATGGIDGPIHLWDVASGKEVRRLEGHPNFVEKLIFTRDGKTLISASYDQTIRVWDVAKGKQARLLGSHLGMVSGLALSPDEKTVASSGYDNLIRRWDLASGKEIRLAAGHEHSVHSVRFTHDGKTLVTGAKDGTVRVWDLATSKELRRHGAIADKPSPSLSVLSPDARILAVAAADRKVSLRSLTSGKELASFKADADVTALRFSPDGKILACGSAGNSIYLCDTRTGEVLVRLQGYADEVGRLAFSPDGKRMAAGGSGGHGTQMGTIYVWEVPTGKVARRMSLEQGLALLPLCFSPDGRMLAAWQGEDALRGIIQKNRLVLLEVATGRERASTPQTDSLITAAAVSRDGFTIAQAGWDHSIIVWDTLTARQWHRFQSDQGRIDSLDFSPDGTRLASGGENTTALVWDVRAKAERSLEKPRELSAKERESLWSDLAAADAARAFAAMKTLHTTPEQTVALFRRHLRPIAAPDAQRVKRLLADLDAEAFAVREKATKELEAMGESAEGLLRQATQGAPSIELRRRVESLLDRISETSPERLRKLRAVEVLEWLNTREARQLLDHLAQGAPGAWLTREAKASLTRCAER